MWAYSEALHGLAREAATATATAKWRQMGVRSVHEALGIYTWTWPLGHYLTS
jgi:hypothetical protein